MGSYESGKYSLGYVDPTDVENKSLKQMMDQFYVSHYSTNAISWLQGSIDKRFKAGDQRLYQQGYGTNQNQNQKFFFNLIRRHINMVCGFQRRNRKSTIFLPVGDQDDPVADQYNKVLRYCDDRNGFQEYASQAFEGAVDTGETLLHLYPDYTFDPISGDLFVDCVAYNNYLIDQFTRKQDLSDCNGIWRRRWTSKIVAKSMLPGYADEIDKMKPGGMKDGRFPLQAELQNVAINNLFTYDEFYYRTTRTGKIILDPHSGEAVEWEESEKDSEDELENVLKMQPWLKVHEVQIPTVKMIIALGDKIVYHGANALQIDDYPFVPVQCYVDNDIQAYAWRKQGMVRGMRDPQALYNMRKVIELQILQSSLNAGWVYPVDVVTDPKCFRQTSGGDGFLIPLKAGHLPGEIQRIEPVNLPSSLMELSRSLAQDITQISGINEELLGSATDDKSGILSMLRQGAGLTTLQTIFDKLDYSQRILGKITLASIRKMFSKGKIKNILGSDPDPRFFTSHAQKYGVAVEEGNYSTTQRQMELQQLITFKELGLGISDKSILRAAFLTNKKQIVEEMQEQNEQQAQQMQAQAQAEQQMQDAKIQAMAAKAGVDAAKQAETFAATQERYAKTQELQASAEHKTMQADLELVKMMVELEDMQFNQFHNAFERAQAVKAANKIETEAAMAAGV